MYKLSILGCRGIPAKYGGFETFAERLALYLVSQGWEVTVYCQVEDPERKKTNFTTQWNGIKLVHIPTARLNAIGSIVFDWKATLFAAKESSLVLTLGYNTAIFSFVYRLRNITNIINMDGVEWKRQKWKWYERVWLYLNEWLGCFLGNHLIADHPQIKLHLASRVSASKITMIPYGAEAVKQADPDLLQQYNLIPDQYVIIIARPEPENHILEIVSAFSSQKRGLKLVVLGRYLPDEFKYHQQVLAAASDEVIFPGAIYEQALVHALRFHARLYIHGHSVGGTNPSLVEALAASSPVLAHDNAFNRWVAGSDAHYFNDEKECGEQLNFLINNFEELQRMRVSSLKRYHEAFSCEKELSLYEELLTRFAVTTEAKIKAIHRLQ